MEFDKSRVYTALNADEVKPGSKVLAADDLGSLRRVVENCQCPDMLDAINSDDYGFRFVIGDVDYMLCYLVSEPNEPRRMTNRELAKWLAQGNGQLRLSTGDISTYFIYTKDSSYVSKDWMIRGWDETEWREPVIKDAAE